MLGETKFKTLEVKVGIKHSILDDILFQICQG